MNKSPLAPVIAGAAGPALGNRLMYEYVARHGPRLALPDTAAEWKSRAAGLRARYLALTPEDAGEQQRIIVEATNAVENIFFLLSQLTRDFQESHSAAAAPVEA